MATKKKAVIKKKVKKTRKVKKTKPVVRKKTTKKKITKKAVVLPALQIVGEVTHFFPHVSAGVIKLTATLKAGDMIQIKGHTTDFKQTIDSIQINHIAVPEAKRGEEIGLRVKDRVRIGDTVYKL